MHFNSLPSRIFMLYDDASTYYDTDVNISLRLLVSRSLVERKNEICLRQNRKRMPLKLKLKLELLINIRRNNTFISN